MIQAVLFREVLCYGVEDKFLDWRNVSATYSPGVTVAARCEIM